MKRHSASALTLIATFVVHLSAQAPATLPPAEAVDFEVVSIKKNPTGVTSGGIRTLPDGTTIMTNQPIRSLIRGASLEDTREIVGLPDWAINERYDVTMKPPAGATREQRRLMSQRMFAERFKAVVHVEQRERNGFALVVARRDGQLGPSLKPSTLNCGSNPAGPATPGAPSSQDPAMSCGMLFGTGRIVSGGMRIASLAPSLEGLAGGPVNDKTGLTDFYAFELRFSTARAGDLSTGAADASDAPEIFTALQEQLGLKLQAEKVMIPVLVIDRLERPTEN